MNVRRDMLAFALRAGRHHDSQSYLSAESARLPAELCERIIAPALAHGLAREALRVHDSVETSRCYDDTAWHLVTAIDDAIAWLAEHPASSVIPS